MMNIHPPKWPLRFLRFFVKKEYLEEIEGDMEELFYEYAEQYPLRKARRLYSIEILKLMRPTLLKNFGMFRKTIHPAMFGNYLKISLRSMKKEPVNSFINVFGLAVAIGFCVLAYGFGRWTFSTDQFHENKNNVFLVTFKADRDGSEQEYGKTPRPLGEMMKQDFPQIKDVCRIDDRQVIVKYEDNVFQERVRFVDPSFLDMFTFPIKWGTSKSLNDINSIVLSEDMSKKYFGEQNPVGATILLKFDQNIGKEFKVTGVAMEFPKALTVEFDFLINFENLRTAEPSFDFHNWNSFVNATLVHVNKPGDITTIAPAMDKYRKLQNLASGKEWAIASFNFEPLATLHERSEFIKDDISRSSRSNYMSTLFLSVLGLFMIILACCNYINIAIVSATRRLKEIGLRKTIGAARGTLVVQFLSENVIMTTVALVVGLILGALFFIPWFQHMNGFDMDFRLTDGHLYIILPLILLFTALVSGFYPALYISKFQVVGILKGNLKFGQKNKLTKIFLGFQLMIACIIITNGVMFTKNSIYLANRSWGYDQHPVVYASVPDESAFEQLQRVMAQQPDVASISGSAHHLGKMHGTAILDFPERDLEVERYNVDANYFKTMGLTLIDGREFHDQPGSDRTSVVVNETLVKNMGWTKPVGQQFMIDSVRFDVIGVVKDFHSYSFFTAIQPVIFRVGDKSEFNYISIRISSGEETEVYKTLQKSWSSLYPEIPFQGGMQEDAWGTYFDRIQTHGGVWRVIAGIAVLLASLGLYGLIKLNVTGRVREFSIRKVLGANVKSLMSNISRQYIALFAVALTIAAPVSVWFVGVFFDLAYRYHIPVTFDATFFAIAVLVGVLFLTVAMQLRKVMKSNPVDGLKVE